jgi:hypothetical protein
VAAPALGHPGSKGTRTCHTHSRQNVQWGGCGGLRAGRPWERGTELFARALGQGEREGDLSINPSSPVGQVWPRELLSSVC